MKKAIYFLLFILFVIIFSGYLLAKAGYKNLYPTDQSQYATIKILDQELRYTQQGSGKDIFLIHGTPGSIEDVKVLMDSLSDSYRVTAYDRPGHGYSTAHELSYTIEENANYAAALIQKLKLDSVLVVGHSYGGCTAMQLAVNKADNNINEFIILGSPLFEYKSDLLYKLVDLPIIGETLTVFFSGPFSKQKIKTGIIERLASPQKVFSEEDLLFRADFWSQPKVIKSKSLETVHAEIDIPKLASKYDNLSKPVTIIMGDQEVPYYVKNLENHLPINNVTYSEFQNCGHFIQLEQTEKLLQIIRENH